MPFVGRCALMLVVAWALLACDPSAGPPPQPPNPGGSQTGGAAGSAGAVALRRAAVNLPWAWTVVTTGRSEGTPSATLSWRGDTQQVSDPQALQEAAAKLTGTGH